MESPFSELNGLKLSTQHIKIWFTAGMGFFTDAYDLFVIGAVLDVFSKSAIPGFSLSTKILGMPASGFIGASALFAAAIGPLVFGLIADHYGRKFVYGIEAVILALGALLSALSPNLYWLIAFRFLLGIGVGGDYPVSATIMSEYANVKDRGKLVALVFANQGLGSVTAVVTAILCVLTLPSSLSWRVMLALGAIPALSVIYLRRKIPETPRYSLLVKRDANGAQLAAKTLGSKILKSDIAAKSLSLPQFVKKYGVTLLATAGTWFLLDMAFYGTGIFSGPIVSSIIPINSSLDLKLQLSRLILEAGVPFFVGFFGYFTSVALMDRLGRKVIQLQGFLAMAALYATISFVMITKGTKVTGFSVPLELALMLYALTFFFIDFGPNTTTFVIPSEVFPVSTRTTGHGISAAAGKFGAALSVFLFPSLLSSIGLKQVLLLLALVSVLGALLTLPLKEPKLVDLESASQEELEVDQTSK